MEIPGQFWFGNWKNNFGMRIPDSIMKIKCSLCGKNIDGYSPVFHRLIIDEERAADICPECIKKFITWQSKTLAVLFPTKALKKRFGRDKQKL